MTGQAIPQDTTLRLHRAMDAAVGLTPEDISNVELLIQVGEWLVAYETLCTQVYEWEISLPAEIVRDLEDLGSTLGARKELAEHLWEDAAGA